MTVTDFLVEIDDRNSVPFQLVAQAERLGSKTFIRFERSGDNITYEGLVATAEAGSTRLRRLGIEAGSMAALYLPNCAEFIAAWFTCLFAGCVDVPVNPEYRKAGLTFALATSGACVVFTDVEGLVHLTDPEVVDHVRQFQLVVVCGADDVRTPEADVIRAFCRIITLSELIASGPSDGIWRHVRASNLASIRFTSGTTGTAKGIMHSHLHMLGKSMMINRILEAEESDVLYSPFPLHHNMTSINGLIGTLQLGGTMVCARRFSASRYWPEICATGATISHILNPMIPMLLAQPPTPTDRAHRVRYIWTGPGSRAFVERFGAQPVQGYALSEVGAIAYRRDGGVEGSAARGPILPEMEVRIVDSLDRPLPVGVEGEISIRPRHPHRMTLGYLNNLAATLTAFRNLWYHTGDSGLIDSNGELHFLGRLGDTVRRRGVSMSSEQIEAEILRQPGIEACAVVGVPSPLGDDDIYALIVLTSVEPDRDLAVQELIRFLVGRLPRDYVPRFFEVATDLPKTITGKVRKPQVRQWVGRGPAFDRESDRWTMFR